MKKYLNFLSEKFSFFGGKVFSIYLNRHVFIMQKNPVSMTYGLRVIIIAGNRPYFSHYFQFLC